MNNSDMFEEVCFLCGVTPYGPAEFTDNPDSTAEELTDALLKHFPDILSAIPTYKSKEDLEAYFQAMFGEYDQESFLKLADAFADCIAIGYFDDDGCASREEVNDPVVKFHFHDGRLVEKRWVDEADGGLFHKVYWKIDDKTGGEADFDDTDEITNTSSTDQEGFGNFFLAECCFDFLDGWIEYAELPPMWDGRQLSLEGEMWEIVNSRKTGRAYSGCLEWLEPGGAEKKLKGTQFFLSTIGDGEVYPVKTAAALQNGYDKSSMRKAIYDDYGYWMFVSPHRWPEAPESKNLVDVAALGFDVLPRVTRQISLSLGCFSRLAIEILCKIFSLLPNVSTYLNLKLVSKGMHDLVMDTKFAFPVLREIIGPDPSREMFWIYPLKNQPSEINNFEDCLYSWLSLKCSSVEKESVTARDILFHHKFPLIQFIHSLYTSDYSRNRRRLWKNVKKFEEVWVDYRRNGWEVNRFGLPYAEETESTADDTVPFIDI